MAKFIEAVLILAGMIIGVGMFGIPFSFVQAGFWLGVGELVVLAGIVLLVHELYGEVVLATPERHRLPGYVRRYLGQGPAQLALFSLLFGMAGTLLAYVVLGSQFLQGFLSSFGAAAGIGKTGAVILLVAANAVITVFPLRREALVNGILTIALIAFILLLAGSLFPKIEPQNLAGAVPARILDPYGVILFALGGAVVVPDLVDRLGRNRRPVRRAIAWGSLIPAALYLLFALAVVGAAGPRVSKDAISGLKPILGNWAAAGGNLIGFLAVFTSLVALSMAFQAFLRLDLKIPRSTAFAISALLPLLLYGLGFQDFLAIIAAVGAIAGGLDIFFILLTHHTLQKERGIRFSPFSYLWKGVVVLLILVGIAYELF